MSAIGSFYIIADNLVDELIDSARASSEALRKKRLWILPPRIPLKHDPYREYVAANCRAHNSLPFSGYAISDLELFIPGCFHSTNQVGHALWEHSRSTSYLSFGPRDALLVLERLGSADYSDGQIREFMNNESRYGDRFANLKQQIFETRDGVSEWLGEISASEIGVITIG